LHSESEAVILPCAVVAAEDMNDYGVATGATPCESPRYTAHAFSGGGGIRTTSKNSAKSVDFGQGGAESGALVPEPAAIDPDLAAVVDAWPTLPAAIKAGILAMIGAAEQGRPKGTTKKKTLF
jgi:hypothetical protein